MESLNNATEKCNTPALEASIEYLAAFYTPPHIAQILTDWVIVDAEDRVLDFSFGGCSFLNASLVTLQNLGAPHPGTQIFGVDIDPNAAAYLTDLYLAGASPEQYICRDFFQVDLTDFGGVPFSAVAGNPPYIRYHDIPEEFRKRAEARLQQFGIQISGRASYWAFFLLYAIHFLKPGGRLALVLPGAFIHTDYSLQVRELLAQHFEQVNICLLQERIFEGTEEESVIVCADGAGRPNKSVRIGTATTAEELKEVLSDLDNKTHVVKAEVSGQEWLRPLVNQDALNFYDQLSTGPKVIRLGDWLQARIGIVTGNNKYFILSNRARDEKQLPVEHFIPVIRRPAYLTGLTVRNKDLAFLAKKEKDYLLLNPPEAISAMSNSLRNYIDEGERDGINLAQKCKARKPWYVVPHTAPPPAFMPCMVASWPRLMINKSNYTCTNNILKLTWKEKRPNNDWLRIALGTLSTLTQLSAELVGRSYGGGVLKVEPTELTRLVIPLLSEERANQIIDKVDALLRKGKMLAATDIVDEALAGEIQVLKPRRIESLRGARNQLFLRRRKHRRDSERIMS
jgi:adenine-specific DNA-methyltransferase